MDLACKALAPSGADTTISTATYTSAAATPAASAVTRFERAHEAAAAAAAEASALASAAAAADRRPAPGPGHRASAGLSMTDFEAAAIAAAAAAAAASPAGAGAGIIAGESHAVAPPAALSLAGDLAPSAGSPGVPPPSQLQSPGGGRPSRHGSFFGSLASSLRYASTNLQVCLGARACNVVPRRVCVPSGKPVSDRTPATFPSL